jgi:hypothetical protein
MSACFYIVVEGEDPGFDTFVSGHALARHEAELERVATLLRVPPLLDYFSADRNSMAMLLEQGAGNPTWSQTLPEAQWFTAREGLDTITTLLQHLAQHPASFGGDTRMLVDELTGYQRVLEKTVKHNLRWHLAVSWE